MMIKVKFKTIWGDDRFHPQNDTAALFCELLKKKTLSREQLIVCKKLGYEIFIPNMNVEKYLSDQFEQ